MQKLHRVLAVGGTAALIAALAACGSNRDNTGTGTTGTNTPSGSFTMGTTDTVTAVDPAGSYDLGSSTLQYSIFQTLLTIPAGSTTPVGDAASSCSYSDPKTFTCHLKPGLKFSNGDALTSADVKYSFQRALTIKDPNGAAIYLLGDIASTDAKGNVTGLAPGSIDTPNPLTVVFHLNRPDMTFASLITYPGCGAIVDQQVFPMDKKLPDSQVIGSGPYELKPVLGRPAGDARGEPELPGQPCPGKSGTGLRLVLPDSQSLKLAMQNGEIDVAWDTLGPTDLAALKTQSNLTVATGAGAAIRYWVWRVDRGPGKSLAVRQAAAEIIDRARSPSWRT